MKKLLSVSVLLVCAGLVNASVTVLPSVISYANYDNGTYNAMTAGGAVSPTINGNAWNNLDQGKYGGRSGIAGDGSSFISYALPSGFSNSAGMVEFWFNTNNSWAGLNLLDLGNGNTISWNANSHILAARTASGNYLTTNLGDYPGGWHHVALTWADSGWRKGTALYFDGALKTNNAGDTSGVNATQIKLGVNWNTTQYDELHVYNAGFVDNLYNIWAANGGTLVEPGYYYQTSIVPEPATLALLVMGGVGALVRRKK
jgi:hypothetical protein